MRTLSLTFCMLFFVVMSQAQDSIFLKNRSFILGRVAEIGESTVSYKKADNPDGPNYKIAIVRLSHIVFENGSTEDFAGRRAVPTHRMIPSHQPSERVARIIKNKELYPRTLPHNLLEGGYYMSQIATSSYYYYNLPYNKIIHGVYLKYEKLLAKEIVGLGIMPFAGINQHQLGLRVNASVYTKFFGQLRVSVGPYYSLTQQKFTHVYRPLQEGISTGNLAYANNDKTVVGGVGFQSAALWHLNKRNLISLGADVGGVVHTNGFRGLPANWERQPPGRGVTQGMLRLGLVRRF